MGRGTFALVYVIKLALAMLGLPLQEKSRVVSIVFDASNVQWYPVRSELYYDWNWTVVPTKLYIGELL